ncbi:tudor domain-containing protein 7 [Lepeophtheirus salmonis]|uniref:Tudor domaincontaining protein 7Alike [Bombus terrestris] n=1 Tax=Lepeophtheirus salmonis TaxID=72036 RepID=A0A0K2UGA7_LEPSM|nr:tudor domain-containing protein 7A-like [Lepeophtheirus salmonis]
MMSTEDQRKEVVDLIRACLLSSKGGVGLDQINKDYKDLVGDNIPFRSLGHNTLTDFFSKARDVCRIMETNGRIIIHPVATESTHHIDNLVSHQKKSSAKGGKRRVQSQYGLSAGRRPNQRSNWIPPSPMNTNGNSNHPRGGRRPTNSRKVGSGRLPPRSSIANSTYRPYPSHQKLRTPSTHHSFTNNQSNSNHSNSYPLKIGTFHSGKPNHHPRSKSGGKNQNPPERSYVKDLTQYYQDKGYGTPEFKTSEMGSKKMRHRTYVSSVTVEGQSFRTFPIEYSSKELAEEAAARLAVDSLGLKRETQNNKHNDGFNFRQAGEINSLIADRIVEIVGDKWNGIWSTQIDVEYKAKYEEVLPPDWPQLIIPTKHHLRIDIPIENHYIVLPMKEKEEPKVNSNNNGLENVDAQITSVHSDLKGDTKEDNFEELLSVDDNYSGKALPPISISEETYWDVYITVISSPNEVVVRLLSENYNKIFEDLTTDMELYYYDYSSKLPLVNEPLVGCLYAAKLDTDWHRVRVTNVHGIKVTCYFIDHGDEDDLNVQNLRPIHPKFLKLPPQALSIKLAGFENLVDADDTILTYMRENVLGRSLVAEVVSRGEKGTDPTLILFDTSTEKDININKKILELSNEGVNCNSSILPSAGEEVVSVYLSYVSSTGICYIQRETPTINLIEKLIDETKDKILEQEFSHSLDINTLYLARNRSDNRWLRAALLTTEVIDEKVEIVHIDYGSHDEVDLSDLRDIGSTKLLSETPYQALKCRLANIPCTYQWTEETTNRLKNLAPENKLLSLKVISSSGDTPEVEIYAKEDDKLSVSFNSIISQLKELFIVNNQDFENSTSPTNVITDDNDKKRSSLSPQDELLFSDIASLKGLVPPKIPEKEEYFDVTVTLAANPSTFYVKPWRQTESLEILTSEMIEFYSSPTRRVVDITLEDLSKDSFFAAVHSDGFWYRIKVDRVLDDQTITVKFVDYGDFAMVNLKNLQPLWPQFRNLPMQAIKAFLSDIVPVNGDWTPADAIWFSNRSVNKQFVSVVKDISQEEDGSVKLGVSLIDVSHPKEDIIIDKLLVDEKRAVYLCI